MMRYNIINIYITAAALLLCSSCADDNILPSGGDEVNSGNILNVGADIEDEVVSVSSRAGEQSKDAETEDWLVQPLKQGLDITYGNIKDGIRHNNRVAILQLQPADGGTIEDGNYKKDPSSGYAEYTFNYRAQDGGAETQEKARWYDNGQHYFEGVHVPYRLRYETNSTELETDDRTVHDKTNLKTVHNLTTDQHDDKATGTDNDLGNYTLLAHYLGMPANTRIAATVARIKLPFRHRLCRVLAYILIDPDLKTNGQPAKIKGYKNEETDQTKPFRDNPESSSIRFCNVDVLGGVHDVYNSTTQLHTLTPTWAEKVRKVVPHFQEQLPTFETKESGDKIWFQNSSNYASAPAGATVKTYQNVPVYDLIIRPTYTSASNVMYDEALGSLTKEQYAAKTNQIDFTVSLDNGLTYEKHVTIDLDANYQTIIYLRITHEGVDYNESGSEKWVEKTYNDQWYGVDNQNGNILSQAGSSWQRAYYNRTLSADGGDKITDGGFYDEGTPGEDGTKGQYISNQTWIENLREAYKGGKHHGDYFVLANDIRIDASLLPTDGLVFTGHLDGFNTHGSRGYHNITLTRGGSKVQYTNDMHEVLSKLYVNADCTDTVPELYYEAQIAQSKGSRGIEKGDPIKLDKSKTYPADLAGMVIYTKVGDTYTKYDNRTFYKICPNYLFAGLDGIYETNQERGQTPWEANVHKEGNYWLPYRDVTGTNPTNTGWRAEVMNLTVEGGTLFKEEAEITGNVSNCKDGADGTNKVKDHTPAMPKYK